MMLSTLLLLSLASEPTVNLDVIFSRVAGEEMKMDIYYPERGESAVSPAVLVIHGGSWMSGKRQDMAQMAKELAKSGFVAATTSYRLAPKHRWPAMIDDVQTAMRFLRSKSAEYRIDPKRVGSCGASAGGHLALLLGFRDTNATGEMEYSGLSSRASAVFNIFGPTDFRRDFSQFINPIVEAVLGKKFADATEDVKLCSPVHWITKDDAPVFTIHGETDPIVPVGQAKWLKESLDKVGIRNEMTLIPKMGHNINSADQAVMETMKRGIEFLHSVLGT
jgi:acetyl esterase/lipase